MNKLGIDGVYILNEFLLGCLQVYVHYFYMHLYVSLLKPRCVM